MILTTILIIIILEKSMLINLPATITIIKHPKNKWIYKTNRLFVSEKLNLLPILKGLKII